MSFCSEKPKHDVASVQREIVFYNATSTIFNSSFLLGIPVYREKLGIPVYVNILRHKSTEGKGVTKFWMSG